MTIREMQDEIIKLKKQNDVCVLAHSYQTAEVREVADFVGDSYKLSVLAKEVKQKNVLMCGVRFMAETVKILSPDKKVLLSNPIAGCPMAEQMDVELINSVKKDCISTGEFKFPNERAAKIAVQTVGEYKRETKSKIKVIFNVFKEYDHEIYKKLLR